MKTAPPDDLDAQLDRLLDAATAPRRDPAFRARVIAAIDRPAPRSWRGWRVAAPVTAATAILAALLTWMWWLPSDGPFVNEEARQEQVTSPAPARTAVGDGTPHSSETPPVVAAQPSAGRRLERRAARSPGGLEQELPNEIEARIPPVRVPEVAVRAVSVTPLAGTPGFEELESPERIEVDPIVVEALDEHR